MSTTKILQQSASGSALERAAYTLAEFCFRNHISRPAYHRLRAEGRGPVEMRLGLNVIRISAESERDWQRAMQEPNEELEQQAVARAVKAGDASVRSDRHISKRGRAKATPPDARHPRVRAKRRVATEAPERT